MRVLEHFAVVAVLDDGSAAAHSLTAALHATDSMPYRADLARDGALAPWYSAVQAMPDVQERGLLLLDPCVPQGSSLWSHHDWLIERLEGRSWEVAYLGHSEGLDDLADRHQRPTLHRCDAVPAGICALALRGASLQRVLDAMPTRAVTGSFTATDWLTIAAWLGRDLRTPLCTWLAWPTLVQMEPVDQQPAAGPQPRRQAHREQLPALDLPVSQGRRAAACTPL